MAVPEGFPGPPEEELKKEPAEQSQVAAIAPVTDPTPAPAVAPVAPVAPAPVAAPVAPVAAAPAPVAPAPVAAAPVAPAPAMPVATATPVGTVAAVSVPGQVAATPGATIVEPTVGAPVAAAELAPAPAAPVIGVLPTTPAPNAPPTPGVALPPGQADEEEIGYTIGIYGPPGGGKTMALRNLSRGKSSVVKDSPKRVLYLDLKGNVGAITNFINPEHWKIKRPVTFMGMLKDIVENSGPKAIWPYDVLVVDQVYQMQEMFISHFKGRDMSDPNALMTMFTEDAWTSKGIKTGPDIAQNEWAVISAAMKQAVDKILTFSNKSLGGKDVIMVFQDGRSEVNGQRCPQIVGKLRELIAASFQAFFLVMKNPENQWVLQTFNDGLAIAKHTFNKAGKDGEVLSLLEGWEPADLGAIFDKIEAG